MGLHLDFFRRLRFPCGHCTHCQGRAGRGREAGECIFIEGNSALRELIPQFSGSGRDHSFLRRARCPERQQWPCCAASATSCAHTPRPQDAQVTPWRHDAHERGCGLHASAGAAHHDVDAHLHPVLRVYCIRRGDILFRRSFYGGFSIGPLHPADEGGLGRGTFTFSLDPVCVLVVLRHGHHGRLRGRLPHHHVRQDSGALLLLHRDHTACPARHHHRR
mmetsp:Transcript_3270/g.8649  ORF Transcript_3270/g.8649 Transcript_3270/m.8649 type:complete len:219 (-) Transcript_3270:558-1214(-)